GIQSLDDAFLKLLGRRHTSVEARQSAAWARQAGFHFNLDFMFGLPGQNLAHWQRTLDQAVALEPDHLSCYLLTLDERVPMGRDVARGKLVLPVDDDLADMYTMTQQHLAQEGYQQYEISNWARPGRASRHNLTYWRDESWIGVGAGAASSSVDRHRKRPRRPWSATSSPLHATDAPHALKTSSSIGRQPCLTSLPWAYVCAR